MPTLARAPSGPRLRPPDPVRHERPATRHIGRGRPRMPDLPPAPSGTGPRPIDPLGLRAPAARPIV